jgi:hypothetical protein
LLSVSHSIDLQPPTTAAIRRPLNSKRRSLSISGTARWASCQRLSKVSAYRRGSRTARHGGGWMDGWMEGWMDKMDGGDGQECTPARLDPQNRKPIPQTKTTTHSGPVFRQISHQVGPSGRPPQHQWFHLVNAPARAFPETDSASYDGSYDATVHCGPVVPRRSKKARPTIPSPTTAQCIAIMTITMAIP